MTVRGVKEAVSFLMSEASGVVGAIVAVFFAVVLAAVFFTFLYGVALVTRLMFIKAPSC